MLVSEADPRLNAGALLAVVDGSTFHAGCKPEHHKVKLSLVRDSRRSPPLQPSSLLESEPTAPKPSAGQLSGNPLPTDPPGWRYLDRMMDHQDAIDRAELERKMGKPKPTL